MGCKKDIKLRGDGIIFQCSYSPLSLFKITSIYCT